MINKLIVLVLITMFKLTAGQAQSIVGAWHWRNSTKVVSIGFKKDGTVSMHSLPKDEAMLEKNAKKGTYSLKDNQLTIRWNDSKVEVLYLKFIEDYSIKLSPVNKNNKSKLNRVFNKIVDEEGTFEK
jgi:hypothetical protein